MKRGITVNFSNKTFYTLIAILSILVISGIVYAVGSVPNPGHPITELQKCDDNGQTLIMAGGVWTCGSGTGGSLSCATSAGIHSGSSGNSICTAMGAGYACTAVSAADEGNLDTGNSTATCGWVSTTAGTYKANCCKII